MRTYVELHNGTYGKLIGEKAGVLETLYKKNGAARGCFDSDSNRFGSGSFLRCPPLVHTDVSVNGQELREALARGEYPGCQFIDRELLRNAAVNNGFGLYPQIGYIAGLHHRDRIGDTQRRLCEAAAHILKKSGGGQLVVTRDGSALGGTTRGILWQENESLLDFTQKGGLKLTAMDFIAVPSFSISTSQFADRFLTNVFAFVKETAALRSERFTRVVLDSKGRYQSIVRAFAPNTLVLVGDTTEDGSYIDMQLQAAMIARFQALLRHEQFSDMYWGVKVDLDNHVTKEPRAARLGMFSVYQPNREENVHRQYLVGRAVLDTFVNGTGDNAYAQATRLLERLGLWAAEATQLPMRNQIEGAIVAKLGEDPRRRFDVLHLSRPEPYFSEYQEACKALDAVDINEIAQQFADGFRESDALKAELAALKKSCVPGDLVRILATAATELARDRDKIDEYVRGDDPLANQLIVQIEESANKAQADFRQKPGLLAQLFGTQDRTHDALDEAKRLLVEAVEKRLEAISMNCFSRVLERIVDGMASGDVRAWAATRTQAETLVAVLDTVKADVAGRDELLLGGAFSEYRGPGMALCSPAEFKAQPDLYRRTPLADFVAAAKDDLEPLYGSAESRVQDWVWMKLMPRIETMLLPVRRPLEPAALSPKVLAEAVRKALPSAAVDSTMHDGMRALFVVAPGGEGTSLKDMVSGALADAGIKVDRERWTDLGEDHSDEVIFVTYEEGVPLRAYKAVAAARERYLRSTERWKSHLQPLYELLPDPTVSPDEAGRKRLFLMACATGVVNRVANDFFYTTSDNESCALDKATLDNYDLAVDIASRFIVKLQTDGFARVISALRQAEQTEGLVQEAEALRLEIEEYAKLHDKHSTSWQEAKVSA